MPQAQASIVIQGDPDEIFTITNDIARWPELFKEYRGAKILEFQRDGRFARIDFELTNEEGQVWQSWRLLDYQKRVAVAQRGEPKYPFTYMHLTWTYEVVAGGVLMTWNQAFEIDPKAPFLRQIAEAGYQEIEFAHYGEIPAGEMAALLDELHLRAVGSHVGLRLLDQDLEREINYCLDINCPVIAIPTLTPQWRSTSAAGYRALATYLNDLGRRCRQRGIALVYHNHDFDFLQDEGTYLLDILLAETDPAYLQLELDCGWAAYCQLDPATYDKSFAEIGEGILDIAAYYRIALECGAQHFLIDNDTPRPPALQSVARSLENLKRMLLAPHVS